MNPRVKEVKAISDHELRIVFRNEEVKDFDMTPYFSFPVFGPLKNSELFRTCTVFNGTVYWESEDVDMSPDTLYIDGKPLPVQALATQEF